MLLHDHLDGGLRPADDRRAGRRGGHQLPAGDAETLRRWFTESADSGSLERYLETFDHTVAVMQTRRALTRVARECVEDLAADGVVYAEVRYAPEQHLEAGLTLDEVVACRAGRASTRATAALGGRIVVRQLLTAMRHAARSREIAELAVAWRDRGVVGFDIAGAEAGYPPTRHLDAFEYLQRRELPLHHPRRRGLRAALDLGGDPVVRRRPARPRRPDHRRHHGRRTVDGPTLGGLAAYVRDKRIPLEMCPSSNVQTGAADSIADHPIGLLTQLRFRVTVNTDNRLMSGTSMTEEMAALVEAFGYDLDDLRWFTLNAMKSAFLPFDERLRIIDEVIKPGYAALGAG